MNSEVVYQVVKALPLEEQKLLLDKLQNDFTVTSNFKKAKKRKLLNEEEAINYLLENVFRKRKQ